MIEVLAWLTVVGVPILSAFAIYYIWRKLFPSQPVDPPAPLKEIRVATSSEQLAEIIYGSYIKYAQNEFWYKKQFEWDFRAVQKYLTPKTKNWVDRKSVV